MSYTLHTRLIRLMAASFKLGYFIALGDCGRFGCKRPIPDCHIFGALTAVDSLAACQFCSQCLIAKPAPCDAANALGYQYRFMAWLLTIICLILSSRPHYARILTSC